MGLILVDPEKCIQDERCVAVCPMRIISFDQQEGVPKSIRGAEKMCIKCGHCVSICPSGALSHKEMSPKQCPAIPENMRFSPEQAEYFLCSRRSTRIYKEDLVDKQLLEKLIYIARYAPSAHNSQPVHWSVVYNTKEVRNLSELAIDWMRYAIYEKLDICKQVPLKWIVRTWEKGYDIICRGAPHVIFAYAPRNERTAPSACFNALAYLELAAPAFGVGTCWAGFLNLAAQYQPLFNERLSIPEDHISFGALVIGYPLFEYHRIPLRKEPEINWLE